MIKYKYGELTEGQIEEMVTLFRSKIYFLLRTIDPNTCEESGDVKPDEIFEELLNVLSGFNSLLGYPKETVLASSRLEQARTVYGQTNDFFQCRRMILAAGNDVGEFGGRCSKCQP